MYSLTVTLAQNLHDHNVSIHIPHGTYKLICKSWLPVWILCEIWSNCVQG